MTAKNEVIRCSPMNQREFDEKFPLVLDWMEKTLAKHATSAHPVGSLGFKRLPLYFSPDVLTKAKVVYVERVPTPPP